MAACGSLQHIFDNLLPENPTLLESLSWNQIKQVKSLEQQPSFTEIFGELHFKESPVSSSPPSSFFVPTSSSSSSSSDETNHTKLNQNNEDSADSNHTPVSSDSVSSTPITNHANNRHKSSDSFSSLSFESLQLCTEGLGFESSDDVEDLKSRMSGSCWQSDRQRDKEDLQKHAASEEESSYGGEWRRSRVSGGGYPPPISCIGRSGKPWVCFKSFRSNGRFVLKEIRIPSQEFLHAYREDGRLKLHFVQPDDECLEEEEEEEEEDDEEEDEEEEEDDGDDDDIEEEEDVGIIEEEEENTGKENDGCKDRGNEEKWMNA